MLFAFVGYVGVQQLFFGCVEVVVTPEFFYESIAIKLVLLGVGVGETSEG